MSAPSKRAIDSLLAMPGDLSWSTGGISVTWIGEDDDVWVEVGDILRAAPDLSAALAAARAALEEMIAADRLESGEMTHQRHSRATEEER